MKLLGVILLGVALIMWAAPRAKLELHNLKTVEVRR